MSMIVDDPSRQIAERVASERGRRGWSLADLSGRSGVSKAMLSKIEREEVSATAAILARLATAFGLTLAGLLETENSKGPRFLARDEQPRWRDPATSYVRRQVFQSPRSPLELVDVHLPAGARVAFPKSSYELIRQVVWVLGGKLEIKDGDCVYVLHEGDRLEFGPPNDSVFRNPARKVCRYLVALVRQ